MDLKKSISKVFSVNMLVLIVGIVSGLLLPAFLNIDQYSILKTYTLYASYIGLFPLGFIDGIYIKYGGKRERDIDKNKFKYEHRFILVFQLFIMIFLLLISIFFKNILFIYLSLTILPVTIIGFFTLYYQATANFTKFTFIGVSNTILAFALNLILILFHIKNADSFILINILSNYFIFFIVELIYYEQSKHIKIKKDNKEIIQIFKIGIFILIGNLSSSFFYAIDRWFVKISLSTEDFAFYSFATSMMGIIIVLINSVATVLYPYFAQGQEEKKISEFKRCLLVIGAFSSGCYFIFAFIVHYFMQKYTPSLRLISILFSGFPAIIIINTLYINLYKVKKKERKYVVIVLKMLAISILLNILALIIHTNFFSIAIAATISFYIWFFYSSKDFSFLKTSIKEISYLTLYFLIFLVSSIKLTLGLGLVVFFIGILLLSYIFYKNEIFILKNTLLRKSKF